MKYLKFFKTDNDYQQFAASEMLLPNVSFCEDLLEVYYNPGNNVATNYFSGVIKLYYHGTSSTRTSFFNESLLDNIKLMKVDDVEITPVNYMHLDIKQGEANDHTFYVELKQPLTSLRSLFNGCNDIVELDLSNIDMSNVTNIAFMCNNCSALTKIHGVDKWNNIKFTQIAQAFFQTNLEDASFMENWDVSNISSLSNVLYSTNITHLDISKWNLPRSLESYKFANFVAYCDKLSYFKLPNYFILPEGFFQYCTSLTEIYYDGTTYEWEMLTKMDEWNRDSAIERVICTDGVVEISKAQRLSQINPYVSEVTMNVGETASVGFDLVADDYKTLVYDAVHTDYYPKTMMSSSFYYFDYDESMISVNIDPKASYRAVITAHAAGTTTLRINAGPDAKDWVVSSNITININ